jgi:5-deoxy-glucuronate isomerase
MSMQAEVAVEKMVFRKTNAQKGRHLAVTPQNSTMRHLSYGRIIVDASRPFVSFDNGNQETALICLSGNATLKANGEEVGIGRFDALYIPRDSSIEISTNSSSVDLAEFSSDVAGKYPLKVVRYAEVAKDPGLKFMAGGRVPRVIWTC